MLMSGKWTVKTGHIPDINPRCPGYGQSKLSIFQTSLIFSVYMEHVYGTCVHVRSRHHSPYSGHHSPYSRHHFFLLSMFRTSKVAVRNMDSFDIPRRAPGVEKFMMIRKRVGSLSNLERDISGQYSQFSPSLFLISSLFLVLENIKALFFLVFQIMVNLSTLEEGEG